jgi:hypothetical protein
MRKFFIQAVVAGMVLTGGCASAPPRPQEGPVHCRLASRATGTLRTISVLGEADLDTRSEDDASYTVEAVIHDARRLSASVRHVDIGMPRERFNVALALDGAPHARLNHIDLDIYLETAIDGQVYLLHCFRDFESPFTSAN